MVIGYDTEMYPEVSIEPILSEMRKHITDVWGEHFQIEKGNQPKKLEIFYLADGYAYLDNPVANPKLEKWSVFIAELYNDILNDKYIRTESTFNRRI